MTVKLRVPAATLFVPYETLRDNQRPRQWLVKGLLDARETGQMFGEWSVGKTFVAIDLVCANATGGMWCEHPVLHPGPTLYVAAEGAEKIATRLRTWELEHGQQLPPNTIFISNLPVHLDREGAEEIDAERKRITAAYGVAPTLVIIDTLAKTMWPKGKENDTGDMGLFMKNVESIGRGERCTKLVIHHSGHTNKERGRGASSGPAGCDFEMRVEFGKLTFTKQKDLKLPDVAYRFYLSEHVVGKDEDGDDTTSCAAVWDGTCAPTVKQTTKLGKHTMVLRTTLESEEGGRATKETWRNRFREATPSLGLKASRNAFDRGVAELVAVGQVSLNGDTYELVPMEARLARLCSAAPQGPQGPQQGLTRPGQPRASKASHPLGGEALEARRRNGPAKGKKKPRPRAGKKRRT